MREIQLEDAEATLSDLIDDALAGNGSVIVHRGKHTAVLISYEEYQKLTSSIGWQLANAPLEDSDLPVRKPGRQLRSDDFQSLFG